MSGMMQDDGMKCPRCHSVKICKNGHKNGKQRYLCKDCRRQFAGTRQRLGYDDAFKKICLKAYRNGKSFREIERTYGVHHTTVLSWVFEDKESLFVASVQQFLDKMPQDLLNLEDGGELPAAPEAVLRQVAIALLTTFSQNKALYGLLQLLTHESEHLPALTKRFIQEVERPLFNQLLTYLKFHPDIQVSDPSLATRMFVGSLMHYSLIQNVLPDSEGSFEERDRLVSNLIAGIIAAA